MKSSYNLFGTKYKIKFVDTVEVGDTAPFRFGETDSVRKTIKVATKDDEGNDLTEDEIEVSFLHELVHSILFEGQYLNCNEDEPLVEWVAKCLRSLKKQGVL